MHPLLRTQVDRLITKTCANNHRGPQPSNAAGGADQSEALNNSAADLEDTRRRLHDASAELSRLGGERAELSSSLGRLAGENGDLAREVSRLRALRDGWRGPEAMLRVRGVQSWGLGGMRTVCVMRPALEGEEGLEPVRWWRAGRGRRTRVDNDDPAGSSGSEAEPEPDDGDSSGGNNMVGSAIGDGSRDDGKRIIMAVKRPSGVKRFAVDTVLGPDVSKDLDRVGDEVEPVVRAALALDGSHSVILAYGHSGAGKTTCLESMITRAAACIFGDVDKSGHGGGDTGASSSSSKPTTGLEVSMSFTQEYLDSLQDLLVEERVPQQQQGEGGTSRGEKKTLRVPVASPSSPSPPSNNPATFHVHNSVVTRVSTAEELLDKYRQGSLRRTVRSTKANSQSSRSHAFLVLTMTRNSSATEGAAPSTTAGPRKGFATLVFMDLGGHERPGNDDDDDQAAAAPDTSAAPKQKKNKKTNKTRKQQEEADLTHDEGVRINTALNHLGTILSPGAPLRSYFEQLSGQRQELGRGGGRRQGPGASDAELKTKPKSSDSNLNKTKAQAKTKGGGGGGGVPSVSTVSHVFRACTLTRLLGHFLGITSSGGSGSGSAAAAAAPAAADLVPRVLEVVLAVAPTEVAANDTVNTLSWVQV